MTKMNNRNRNSHTHTQKLTNKMTRYASFDIRKEEHNLLVVRMYNVAATMHVKLRYFKKKEVDLSQGSGIQPLGITKNSMK